MTSLTLSQAALLAGLSEPQKLHDHQEQAIEKLRNAHRQGYRRIMLESPTASGKTVIAGTMVRGALQRWFGKLAENRRPKAVYFMVNAKSLLKQTMDKFAANGIPVDQIGMLGDGKRLRLDAPVIVTTWQSLRNRHVEL